LDATGAAVPEARVNLVSATTGAERAIQTDRSGGFVISALGPGRYSLSVEVTGFRRLVRNDIVLTPSERLSVGNLTLELGALAEQVTVTAAAAPVQTASAERSTAITSS
jgi:hypothetical protein